MNIFAVHADELKPVRGETCLVIPLFEGAEKIVSGAVGKECLKTLQALLGKNILSGKAQSCYYLATPGAKFQGLLTLGLGPEGKLNAETVRRAAGKASALLRGHRTKSLYLDLASAPAFPADAFVEGLVLAQYDFNVYKRPAGDASAPVTVNAVTLITHSGADNDGLARKSHRAALIATGVNGARQLANTAANEMTPTALAEFAKGVARESNCSCTVLDHHEMADLGMNALLGVAKGSAEAPKLILLEYRHPGAKKTVAVAGKGVCFDSGGISIKPAHNMHEMKYDMCGAAAVLCAMMTVANLGPKINVVAVVPAVENKTGARAQTPGDIVRAYNGKTIEVHNTDAEGRLILADAMSYVVDKYKPDALVDLATLTGACVVALGHFAAGVLGNNEPLLQSLVRSGEATGDRLWPLPLWEDYEKLIEGDHADLCNIGPGRDAGTITAAAFLKHFVGGTPWAHIDIAGTAYGVKNAPHLSAKSATGFGVRLLVHWLLAQAETGKRGA
ncbi:MAG: leucyl aminopeptidase [Candidatus Hydrogenedentes bacterium]|nr:leucyl aminopeptidase [Candidatus Hydrogenedentota bacterium]